MITFDEEDDDFVIIDGVPKILDDRITELLDACQKWLDFRKGNK